MFCKGIIPENALYHLDCGHMICPECWAEIFVPPRHSHLCSTECVSCGKAVSDAENKDAMRRYLEFLEKVESRALCFDVQRQANAEGQVGPNQRIPSQIDNVEVPRELAGSTMTNVAKSALYLSECAANLVVESVGMD